MDITLFCTLLGTLYPPLKDVAAYVSKRRGTLNKEFKDHLRKMITLTQEDLSKLKTELEELKKVCAELNIVTGEPGNIPWRIPHDMNSYLSWRYRRTAKKVENLCDDFKASMDGVIDVIACCAGIMEKTDAEGPVYQEQDWVRDLTRDQEELSEKLVKPSRYSLDDVMNAMEQFIDKCRLSMQKLAKELQ